MFFVAAKILWFFTAPANLLLAIALIALLPRGERARKAGRRIALTAVALLLTIGLTPLGVWLIEPLEDRFPPPSADLAAPYGIIVLGGAIDDELGRARGQVTIEEGATRLTSAVALSRRFPEARLVYTGGSGSLTPTESSEAQDAGKLWASLGVDPKRVTLEDRSRNTDENARFTAAIVHPEAGQKWLLVTSAYHMPRSMALFRKAGFDVEAYPVDYHSQGGFGDLRINRIAWRGIAIFDLALHEWVGLVAYRLSGKIDDFFPAP